MNRSTTRAEKGQWENVDHLTSVTQMFFVFVFLYSLTPFIKHLHLEKNVLFIFDHFLFEEFLNIYDHIYWRLLIWILIEDSLSHSTAITRQSTSSKYIHSHIPWDTWHPVVVTHCCCEARVATLVGNNAVSDNFRFIRNVNILVLFLFFQRNISAQ